MYIKKYTVYFLLFALTAYAHADTSQPPISRIMQHVEALAGDSGIGPRVAASDEEKQAANYIINAFEDMGVSTEIQPFEAVFRGQTEPKASQNVIAKITGKSDKTFVIGAHYDSVPESTGSMGVIDNAGSVAVMIELARHISSLPEVDISFLFVAYGAEEVGLNGAKHHVASLDATQREKIIGMINLDSITGGDNLYIHSALTEGYTCDGDKSNFKASPVWRDQMLALAQDLSLPYQKHPGNEGFPSGETGGWSDHAPYACAGIPFANLEATNFSVVGENGKDGYSQTQNPNLWDCFDAVTQTTCDKENERKWGKIWHTQFDRLDVLNAEFPGRIEEQLTHAYDLLTAFVVSLD